MGVSSSIPQQHRPVYTLVYAPWHVDAPDLLAGWQACIEHNHEVADFSLVNAIAEPPKASERSAAGSPPYILKDGKVFIKDCAPSCVQKIYNDVRRLDKSGPM